MGSVINRGNGKWELRISLGKDDKGKQVRKTKRVAATSKRAALKELDKFQWDISHKNVRRFHNMTFKEFAAIWSERHNSKLSLTTRTVQESMLNNRLMDYFSGIQLKNIDANMILDFIETIRLPEKKTYSKRMRNGKSLSETMIHKNYKLLNNMLSMAVEWEMINQNPCDDVPKSKRPKPIYRHNPIWQEKDLQRFLHILETIPNTPMQLKNKTMFYLSLLTGTRKGELCALTWEDIDWENNAIAITKAQKYIGKDKVEIGAPKTAGSVRRLFIDDYAIALLHKHKSNQDRYLCEKGYENPNQYVFLAVRQRNDQLVPVSASCLYMWMSKICRAHSLPHITVHSLRAMAATYALNHGAALTTVQTMLGHENIRTTSIYLHPLDAQRKQTTGILSGHLQELMKEDSSRDEQ